MTTALVLKSFFELTLICLLIFGFIHEKQVIAFEQKVWRILYVNCKRYQRKKRYQKMQKNRDFRVVNGQGKPAPRHHPDGTTYVA